MWPLVTLDIRIYQLVSSECDEIFKACQVFRRELEMPSVCQNSYLQQNQLVLPALMLVWLVDLKVAYACRSGTTYTV